MGERKPDLSHEILISALIDEFCDTYGTRTPVELLDEHTLKRQPLLMDAWHQYLDWKWRFGETPYFEHNIETRFDWGIVVR
jgi:lipoate-protein ligase A